MPYKDREKQKLNQREWIAAKRLEIRILVSLIKESKPCMDCNKWFPYYVMHFDHLFDKEFEISKFLRNPSVDIQKLLDEIKKCDLVCSNCHAIRSQMRL